MQANLISRFYLWGKKLSNYPQTHMRFWVNLQVSTVLTRKPANLRMGKGKGGRAGGVAKVNPGSTLLAFSWLRSARIKAIKRKIQVRCNFKVAANFPQDLNFTHYFAYKAPKRSYLLARMYELRAFFRRTNQAQTYQFLGFLFRWFRFKPRLNSYRIASNVVPESLNLLIQDDVVGSFALNLAFWSTVEDIIDLPFELKFELNENPIINYEYGDTLSIWYAILDNDFLSTLNEDDDLEAINIDLNYENFLDLLLLLPANLSYSPYNQTVLAWKYFFVLHSLEDHIFNLNYSEVNV